MPQTAILNGRAVADLGQTAPMETTQSRYMNMTSDIAQHFVRLGVAHVIIGALCIIFQIVSIAIAASVFSFVGHGIWTGCLFVITGIFGILAGKKRGKCQVVIFQALSTISIGFACILLLIAALSVAIEDYKSTDSQIIGGVLLIIVAFVECVVSLSSSLTGCVMGACCCNCGGSCCCPTESEYHQFDDSVLWDSAEQQFTSNNQPQPMMFNTSNHQPTLNPNHQLPVCNASQHQPMLSNQQRTVCNNSQQHPMLCFNQQQPVFSNNQQQPMFNPYQLMFNPNQQQLIFSPNQQQVMVNPNQQQPLFYPNLQQTVLFPTQQTTGLFPLQQAVQFYALQPNTTLNSQQSNFVSLPSGATGQEADGGSHSELMTSNRPVEQPRNLGGNGSDEGPVYFDEAEVFPHEGTFGDSEERY